MSQSPPTSQIKIMAYSDSDQVGLRRPQIISDDDLERISSIIAQAVRSLETQLQPLIEPKPGDVGLSEINLTFGVDFEAESKLPILGPILSAGVKAGTTFQVSVKLSRRPK